MIHATYASNRDPQASELRTLTPLVFVNSGYRWHISAYHHEKEQFKDFVLARFKSIEILRGMETDISITDDEEWNTFVNIDLIPNPMFSATIQKQIMKERGISNGKLSISCRVANISYQQNLLQISRAKEDYNNVFTNPVIIGNYDELEIYLKDDYREYFEFFNENISEVKFEVKPKGKINSN